MTRARAQAGPLVQALERLGHEVVEFPLIEIEGIEGEENRRLIEDYAYWLANS